MKSNPISFSELSEYNDSNSCVVLAVLIDNESDVEQMNDFLAKELGF